MGCHAVGDGQSACSVHKSTTAYVETLMRFRQETADI